MMIGATAARTKRLFSSVFVLASTISRPSITSAFTTAVSSPFRVAATTTARRMSTSTSAAEVTTSNDPHKFLEDVLGDKSLEWVKTQNENCIAKYGDPTDTSGDKNSDYQRILDILDSKDKIPVRNNGFVCACACVRVCIAYV